MQPLLVDPPSLADLRDALSALVAADDSPRASKTVKVILERASDVLRGGPSLGISGRAFWQRSVAEVRAERLLWSESAWNARRLPELERSRRGWVESVFPDRDDEYERVWHDKLAFLDVPNGDLIAVDISRADRAPVVYLSHDGGKAHGRVLGSSVIDFIDRWSLVACVGPEEWTMMPFLRPAQPYLDAAGETARAWRAWIGIEGDTLA